MKRLLVLVVLLSVLPFVSAGFFDDAGGLFNIDGLGGEELLLARLLILLLVFILVFYAGVRIFRGKKGIALIVAVVAALLAFRYLSEYQVVYGVLLPYNTLGILLITLLPFLIFLLFVHVGKMGSFVRKLAWLIFAGIYLYLLVSNYGEMSEIGRYIYFAFFGLIVLAYLFDKQIQKYLFYRFKIKKEYR